MKDRIILLVISVLMLFTAIGFAKLYENERLEKVRLQGSLKATTQKLEYFTTKSGAKAARNLVVKLKTSELKESFPHEIQEAKNLDVLPNRIENYSETASQTNISITVPIQDSLYVFKTK